MNAENGLRRALGLVEAVALVAGSVIGTGIFLKPRVLAELLGSPGLILLVWIVGGALSFLGAISYAELGALYPQAGGEYHFLKAAYGRFAGYLWAWTYFVCAKIGTLAAMAAGLAIYLQAFVPLPGFWEQGVAILVVLVITLINILGVAVGGRAQTVLTALKLAAIVAMMALAWLSPSFAWQRLTVVPSTLPSARAIGLALIAVLWAYDGWNNLFMVGGEMKDPQRNVLRATLFGMGIVVLLYLAANLTYLCAVPITDMPRVARVAEAAVSGSTGPAGAAIISGMILISILGALNGSALSGGRIPYAAAVDGLFPAFLAKIHARYRTPAWALLTQGLLTVLLIVVFTALGIAAFDKITDMVIFAEGGFYALCAAAVLILRRRDPQRPRPYLAWGYPWSQWVFIAAAIWLCFNSLIAAPMQSLLGLGLIALGLPFYRRRATGSVTEA